MVCGNLKRSRPRIILTRLQPANLQRFGLENHGHPQIGARGRHRRQLELFLVLGAKRHLWIHELALPPRRLTAVAADDRSQLCGVSLHLNISIDVAF